MLLATDLDGTFIGGKDADKERLYELIRQDNRIRLVFVTGRGIKSVLNLLEQQPLPRPEYIICDVGATITHMDTLKPVEPVQSDIAKLWPGETLVRERMSTVDGLIHQEAVQQYRCSYCFDDNTDVDSAAAIAADLHCDFLLSAGKYLDILPRGVNKGSTLRRLIEILQVPAEAVLVAGDSMNDHTLYDAGYNGVVVGGSEQALVRYTANRSHVLHANKPGAGGILEALSHFPEFNDYLRRP